MHIALLYRWPVMLNSIDYIIRLMSRACTLLIYHLLFSKPNHNKIIFHFEFCKRCFGMLALNGRFSHALYNPGPTTRLKTIQLLPV